MSQAKFTFRGGGLIPSNRLDISGIKGKIRRDLHLKKSTQSNKTSSKLTSQQKNLEDFQKNLKKPGFQSTSLNFFSNKSLSQSTSKLNIKSVAELSSTEEFQKRHAQKSFKTQHVTIAKTSNFLFTQKQPVDSSSSSKEPGSLSEASSKNNQNSTTSPFKENNFHNVSSQLKEIDPGSVPNNSTSTSKISEKNSNNSFKNQPASKQSDISPSSNKFINTNSKPSPRNNAQLSSTNINNKKTNVSQKKFSSTAFISNIHSSKVKPRFEVSSSLEESKQRLLEALDQTDSKDSSSYKNISFLTEKNQSPSGNTLQSQVMFAEAGIINQNSDSDSDRNNLNKQTKNPKLVLKKQSLDPKFYIQTNPNKKLNLSKFLSSIAVISLLILSVGVFAYTLFNQLALPTIFRIP